jgi:osmoprotectant transport system permease protein
MNNLLSLSSLLSLTGRYLLLIGVSGGLAIVIGVLVGIAVTRPTLRPIAPILLGLVNVGQSVPSLAVLALSIGFLGLGFKPAIFALILYSLLPVVRNTTVGINKVDRSLVEAAYGMGLTGSQVLFQVEIPLAIPVIMSGVRTAVMVNVGTAALGALIGAGGLGNLIFTGLSMEVTSMILAGAGIIAAIAVALDLILEVLTRRMTPHGVPVANKAAV